MTHKTELRPAKTVEEQLRACNEKLLIAKLRPRFWLARLFVAMQNLAIVTVAWFENDSLTARAIDSAGQPAWLLIVALFICCAVALADVIVNDLMPDQFLFLRGLEHRYLGYLGMALLLGIVGFIAVFKSGFTTLLLFLWLNAAFAATVGWLDIFTRYRRAA